MGEINAQGVDVDADLSSLGLVVNRIYGTMSNYSLVPLPLFVFMGHMLDQSGVVTSMTDHAADLVRELGHVPVATSFGIALPGEAYVVAARARARAQGREGPDPIARVRVRSGGWLTVRGECTRDANGSLAETALVIEPSRTSEILPLFVAAHGLSDREKEVLAELVDGRSTSQIADVLFISTHTVRDHVKSILTKVGVGSRGELVSELYRLHYEPGLDITHLP